MSHRLLRGLLAILLLLVTAEIGLQLLALATKQGVDRTVQAPARAGELRILCMGDSHTYGAGVDPEGAYPRQLEAALAQRLAPRPVRVINAGFPGVNSAFVAKRLEERIAEFDPHLILIWVGTNNRWNRLETDSRGEARWGSRIHGALLHSKLYRYATVLVTASRDESDPAGGFPWASREAAISDEELVRGISYDLGEMAATARAVGVPIAFITYPLQVTAGPNAAIIHSARALGAPAVVTARAYRRALDDGYDRHDLIVNASGPHPTALLYAYVVRTLEPIVLDLLGQKPVNE